MKRNGAIFLLVIVAVALGVALVVRHQKAEEKGREYQAAIVQLSNEWNKTSAKLSEQTKVNASLETNLSLKITEADQLTNKITSISNQLAKAEADAKAAAKAADEEMAKRDTKIKELENQNDGLTKSMDDLKGNITTLEGKIAETQQKLATSQGEKEFLVKELKRLQAEKAELERQFNDLAVLREQVSKLKEQLSISRRLEWIRRGLYGEQKGGERLQQGLNPKPAATTNYDLNVELKRDGGAKVIPNAPPATTTPAPAPAPAK